MDKPQKQHYLFKHPQKRISNDGQSTYVSPQSQLLSKISDIRVVNDFSIDSQYFDRSSILEQSLEQDLRTWQQHYQVDNNVLQKLEQQIKQIDQQIVQLATQFDICLNLQSKTEQKFTEFQQLLKGTEFTKFSRSNCKKYAKRQIFYCPFLEAICWKSKADKFPTSKQLIQIDSIVQIHTNYQKYRSIRKTFQLPADANPDHFLAIEARSGRLELLASSKEEQQLYVKTLNLLLTHTEFHQAVFLEQYSGDINQIRRVLISNNQNLDASKTQFVTAIDKLQQSFITTTQTLLKQEKEKMQTMKKKSKNLMFQNRIHLDDLQHENDQLKANSKELQLENQYLLQRLDQLQQTYNQKQTQIQSTSTPQLIHISSLIQDIIRCNGDQIASESQCYVDEDHYNQSVCQLQKLKQLLEQSQETELSLRSYQQLLQSEKQLIIQQNKQLSADLIDSQTYVTELENMNNLLQNKLVQLSQSLEQKEIAFKDLIIDMQKMQEHFPMQSQLKSDNEKLKEALHYKLSDLRSQILKEEKSQMIVFAHLIAFICAQLNEDLTLEGNMQINILLSKLQDRANKDPNSALHELMQHIKAKTQFFQRNHHAAFEKTLSDCLQSYHQPVSLLNTSQSCRTFHSPSRVYVKGRLNSQQIDHQFLKQLLK